MTTFNYFYEGQEEQYAFFRIPKKLIKIFVGHPIVNYCKIVTLADANKIKRCSLSRAFWILCAVCQAGFDGFCHQF